MQTELEYDDISVSLPTLYLCWRKVLDISFGFCGAVLLLLILPFLALCVYVDSPGPLFYKQERVGYQKKKFYMYKFRSMCPNAEQKQQPFWASRNDTRITRVGKILRATHLDELPQVFNILRGEMSLIGPRPEREAYVIQLEQMHPLYNYRFSVKPGLTGWAQVMYGYGDTSQDELRKLTYDLYYIKYQSFLLDMRILLKTIGEVVFCHGV